MNIAEQEKWNALREQDLPSNVLDTLVLECPDRALLVSWLQEYFEGTVLPSTSSNSSDNNGLFLSWLWHQFENSDLSIFYRKFPRLMPIVSLNYSTKINSIAQRHCNVCVPDVINDAFPIYNIPLRIIGRSRQAMRSVEFLQYQSAIKQHLIKNYGSRKIFQAYCMSLTFVMNNARRERDIDNMSKALIDATSRALGFDDKHVHHLDAIKLIFPDAEERIYIRLAPSFINTHTGVAIREHRHSWAGQQPLE